MGWLKSWYGWLLLALGLGLLGSREWRLYMASADEPRRISCERLEREGPEGNAHVVLTDALLCVDALVYREKYGRWSSVLVPAVPRDGAYARSVARFRAEQGRDSGAKPPPPRDVKVLVRLRNVRSHEEARRRAADEVFEGHVVNESDPLDSSEQGLLETAFPHLDPEGLVLLEVGRTPPSATRVALYAGGALGSGVIGLLFLRHRWRQRRAAKRAARAAAAAAEEGDGG